MEELSIANEMLHQRRQDEQGGAAARDETDLSQERIEDQDVQSYEVTEEGVVLRSRYYNAGKISLPFHRIYDGGAFYKRLRDAGRPRGGVNG